MMFNLIAVSQFIVNTLLKQNFNHYINQTQSCQRIPVYIYFNYFECDSTLMGKIKYIL